MNLEALKHLGRVVEELVTGREITVIGSSAWLVPFPELGEAGQPLETSLDANAMVDPLVEPDDPEMIMESVGSSSRFQKIHGYHVDLMRPAIGEMFPQGWRERRILIPGTSKVMAMEAHDVGVAKLRVGREKDMKILSLMCSKTMLDPVILEQRLRDSVMNEAEIVAAHGRLRKLMAGS